MLNNSTFTGIGCVLQVSSVDCQKSDIQTSKSSPLDRGQLEPGRSSAFLLYSRSIIFFLCSKYHLTIASFLFLWKGGVLFVFVVLKFVEGEQLV